MKTLKYAWRRIMFHLLPKDIRQEMKRGLLSDLVNLKRLGLVEDSGIGVKVSAAGLGCLKDKNR